MERFTVEEINLICIYDTSGRERLINEIKESLPYVYEPELIEIMENAIYKLENMTDGEFFEVGLIPC